MAINPAVERPSTGVVEAQFARVAGLGCARHPYLDALLANATYTAARDLADAVHLLCGLHGRYPGLLDLALQASTPGTARDWLSEASDSFERERLYLVRLTSAIGPLPSTPGAAETESVLQSQRHAIETLARSERRGCALGAATALIEDWRHLRTLLDRAANRAGLDIPASSLPDEATVAAAIAAGTDGMASERALAFGAEQLLHQHRGLFDLLQARAEARVD